MYMNMFALAVETRQYTKCILYLVLCQVNFSKFIPYPKLHFSECKMGIMWKKTIQARVKALGEGVRVHTIPSPPPCEQLLACFFKVYMFSSGLM